MTSSSTDWKKVIEDNRGAIEGKMVELHREMANNNPNVHVGLGIEPDGTLFTWTWVGTESIPESIRNKTDFRITKFSAWDWTDNDPNLLEAWMDNYKEIASDLLDCIIEQIQ